jgi:hypothetical protein
MYPKLPFTCPKFVLLAQNPQKFPKSSKIPKILKTFQILLKTHKNNISSNSLQIPHKNSPKFKFKLINTPTSKLHKTQAFRQQTPNSLNTTKNSTHYLRPSFPQHCRQCSPATRNFAFFAGAGTSDTFKLETATMLELSFEFRVQCASVFHFFRLFYCWAPGSERLTFLWWLKTHGAKRKGFVWKGGKRKK